jgi:hypothetical protein
MNPMNRTLHTTTLSLVAMIYLAGFAPLGIGSVCAQVTAKWCGNCGASVSVSAQVGDHCPSCGAYWGEEKTVTHSTPESSQGSGGYAPSYPSYPMTGMVTPAMVQMELLRQRQAELEWRRNMMQTRRDAEAVRRSTNRQRVANRAVEAQISNDPVSQVDRYIHSAVQCELSGQTAAAVAYYRLVMRRVPESRQADYASTALSRLEAR